LRILKYINSNGVELVMTNTAPFVLQSFDDSNAVNIYNSKGVAQDGANYLGNTLDVRVITMQVAVMSNFEEEAINNRRLVEQAFNPKLNEGWLIYKDDVKEIKIKCIASKLPYFSPDDDISLQTCLISLTANNPLYQAIAQIKAEIALWIGEFEFPLELVSGGIEMGMRSLSLIVDVLNTGDIPCGMTAVFTALATLTNPSITDVNTGLYIKINKTMTIGEVLTVSTGFGNKKVTSTLNGVTTNAFNYIDIGSTFLQLAVGDNLYRYNSDTNTDNLTVSIYYTPQYLGA
jgi:hypothetical protein